jgi:hypothetical protein
MTPYGFHVHAAVDGGSNFVVYATLALNKDASSLYAGYEQAVRAFGSRPLKVRADMCWEAAAMVGADIIEARGRQAYLVGPSTANQV